MCIAAAVNVKERLIPAVTALRDAIATKSKAWDDIIKIGRTHMQDATPLTLGQEWSGYAGMLSDDLKRIEGALSGVYRLALVTAVGPMAAALWTSYDASFPAQMGGGDEKALPSRRQTSQGATPQGVEAEGPQCAQSRPPPQFIPYWPDRGRAGAACHQQCVFEATRAREAG